MLDNYAVTGLSMLLGYIFGSVPYGLVLTKLAGTTDLRSIGSGNIGATNVLRTGRKDLAAATLLLDGLKGACAVFAANAVFNTPDAGLFAASGAFTGHLFPIWLQFRGGKGVATFLGCLLALAWQAGAAFILVWLAIAYFTRFSSAAALAASAIAPLVLLALGHKETAVLFAAMALALWWMHRANIARLVQGAEGRIGQKS